MLCLNHSDVSLQCTQTDLLLIFLCAQKHLFLCRSSSPDSFTQHSVQQMFSNASPLLVPVRLDTHGAVQTVTFWQDDSVFMWEKKHEDQLWASNQSQCSSASQSVGIKGPTAAGCTLITTEGHSGFTPHCLTQLSSTCPLHVHYMSTTPSELDLLYTTVSVFTPPLIKKCSCATALNLAYCTLHEVS